LPNADYKPLQIIQYAAALSAVIYFLSQQTASLFVKFVLIMGKELSNKQKQEWAELLFMQQQLTQKEIAVKVGVAEKTLSGWKDKYCWEQLRKSLLTSKSEILRFLYNTLDKLKTKIENADDGIGDTKLADMVIKYTAAIKSLETETSIAALMDAGMQFHKYLQAVDPTEALKMLNNYDGFIKERIKRF
jgi:hypothetical protein